MKPIPHTFYLISLGCAKNLVDSQGIWNLLSRQGFTLADNPEQAEFIIVNTCAFIHDAREESLQELNRMASLKRNGQKLIAAGCLSERYQSSLLENVPGIDGIIGTRDLTDILPLVKKLTESTSCQSAVTLRIHDQIIHHSDLPGYVIQGRSSYLKIADGCRRACAFCAIPNIKGTLVSRPKADILHDAQELQAAGAQEINIIAQDVTDYGQDLGLHDGLSDLLTELIPTIPYVPWIRLLYAFPWVCHRSLDQSNVRIPTIAALP